MYIDSVNHHKDQLARLYYNITTGENITITNILYRINLVTAAF